MHLWSQITWKWKYTWKYHCFTLVSGDLIVTCLHHHVSLTVSSLWEERLYFKNNKTRCWLFIYVHLKPNSLKVTIKKTKEELCYGNKVQFKNLKHIESSTKYDVAQEVVHDDMMKNVEKKLQWNVQRFTSH